MTRIGLNSARSAVAHSMEEALQVQAMVGYPVIIRPSLQWAEVAAALPTTVRNFWVSVNADWKPRPPRNY